MEKEDVIRKIKALLRLAGDKLDSPEAKLAMQRAGEMMGKYGLEASEIKETRGEKLKKESLNIYIKAYIVWEGQLIMAICETFDCKVIRLPMGNETFIWYIIGYKGDVEIVTWFFKYLRIVISKMSEKKYKKVRDRRDYCLGATASVAARLKEMYKAREQAMAPDTKDLVLYKKQEVNKEFDKMFPKTTKITHRQQHNFTALDKGHIDGKHVSLSKPIKNDSQRESGLNTANSAALATQ